MSYQQNPQTRRYAVVRTALLIVTALLSSAVSARRATRIDPTVAMRVE